MKKIVGWAPVFMLAGILVLFVVGVFFGIPHYVAGLISGESSIQLNTDLSGLSPWQQGCVTKLHIFAGGQAYEIPAQKPITQFDITLSQGDHQFIVTAAHEFSSRQSDGETSRGIYTSAFEAKVVGDQKITVHFYSSPVTDWELLKQICSK